jgi:hypothetical protein
VKNQHAEDVFLELLAAYNAAGRHVTSTTGANYAPAVFSKEERGQPIGKRTLETAMNRLFEAKRINLVEYGPPSRRLKSLEATP